MTANKIQSNKKPYSIPKKGSLGLLALGHVGVQIWRRKILGVKDKDRRIVGPVVLGKEIPTVQKKSIKDEKK